MQAILKSFALIAVKRKEHIKEQVIIWWKSDSSKLEPWHTFEGLGTREITTVVSSFESYPKLKFQNRTNPTLACLGSVTVFMNPGGLVKKSFEKSYKVATSLTFQRRARKQHYDVKWLKSNAALH